MYQENWWHLHSAPLWFSTDFHLHAVVLRVLTLSFQPCQKFLESHRTHLALPQNPEHYEEHQGTARFVWLHRIKTPGYTALSASFSIYFTWG